MIDVFVSRSSETYDRYGLFIGSLGYETRCSFAASIYARKCSRRLALVFNERLVGSFAQNRNVFNELNFEFLSVSDLDTASLAQIIIASHEFPLRLLVDISSMSRPMIARVVLAIKQASQREVYITFVYCPARFTEPPQDGNVVAVSEPVLPEFAGWSIRPDHPVAAIVGLGFEQDLALGTLEFLEPAAAWAFVPFGESLDFDLAVDNANRDLLEELGSRNTVKYNIHSPYDCFVALEALSYGLASDMRPVLVPFGPKLFALLCLLVATQHEPNIAVWRVSGEQAGVPEDRMPSGRVVVSNVCMTPRSIIRSDDFPRFSSFP